MLTPISEHSIPIHDPTAALFFNSNLTKYYFDHNDLDLAPLTSKKAISLIIKSVFSTSVKFQCYFSMYWMLNRVNVHFNGRVVCFVIFIW